MKHFLSIFLWLIFLIPVHAQTDISFTFNATDIGRDVGASLRKNVNNHSLELGLSYFINRDIYSNQNFLYRKSFHPESLWEHIGVNAGWQYEFHNPKEVLIPMVFFRTQFINSQVGINSYVFSFSEDSIGTPLYSYASSSLNKTKSIASHVGLGLRCKIYKNIYLYQKAGYGINLIFNNDPAIMDPITWQFSELLTTGIIYRF